MWWCTYSCIIGFFQIMRALKIGEIRKSSEDTLISFVDFYGLTEAIHIKFHMEIEMVALYNTRKLWTRLNLLIITEILGISSPIFFLNFLLSCDQISTKVEIANSFQRPKYQLRLFCGHGYIEWFSFWFSSWNFCCSGDMINLKFCIMLVILHHSAIFDLDVTSSIEINNNN